MPTNSTAYQDTPWYEFCTASDACTGNDTPTFWTSRALASVHTQLVSGTTGTDVDRWTLAHTFPVPGDGTAAAMWLSTVDHTGYASGSATNGPSSLATPTTSFGAPQMLANRVNSTSDGLVELNKARIYQITTDSGASIRVDYDFSAMGVCSPSDETALKANPSANTRPCFPEWFQPSNSGVAASLQFFQKYRVADVVTTPLGTHPGQPDPPMESDYLYTSTPAWRFDLAPTTPPNRRTWSVFAGYGSVEVRAGSSASPATQTTTDYTFFRGLKGDPDGPITTPTSSFRSTEGTAIRTSIGVNFDDELWRAGLVAETKVRDGANGAAATSTAPATESSTAVLTDTVVQPWYSNPTETDSGEHWKYTDPVDGTVYSGDFSASARHTGDAITTVVSRVASGSTRTTTTSNTFDDTTGYLTSTDSKTPDAGETCTSTSYDHSAGGSTLDVPVEVLVADVACSQTAVRKPGDVVSDTLTGYDGGSPGDTSQTVVARNVTSVQSALSYTAGVPTGSSPVTHTAYDGLGRPTSSTDADGNVTKTAYTPADGSPLTSSTVTNAAGFATTTAYNPAWGAATDVTDANNHTTSATYDALGRRSQVWAPDRPKASNATPNTVYSYTLNTTTPMVVTTQNLMPNGSLVASYAFFDSLGRAIQTQTPSESVDSGHIHRASGAVITDTFYDAHGWTVRANNAYYATTNPSTTAYQPGTAVPSSTVTTYDNYGRKTADILVALNASTGQVQEKWRTSYVNTGVDRVDTTPPAGGTPTSVFTDSRGRVSSRVQYLASTVSAPATHEVTSYGYDLQNNMTGMTDPAGNHWSWTFDLLGRQTDATDPDTGSSHTDYDAAGNTVQTIDGNGTKLKYDYDNLNRKQHEYEFQPANNGWALDAAWTYDTAGKGLPYSSIRLVGSTPSVNGTQYTRAVTAYDAADRPTSSVVSVPNWAGSTAPTSFTWSMSYYPDGSPRSMADPAAGSFPAETVKTSYTPLGRPYFVGGRDSILGDDTYDHLNRLQQMQLTNGATEVDVTNRFDDGTGRLLESSAVDNASSNFHVADHVFTYDDAGLLTSDVDRSDATGSQAAAVDVQCYGYDFQQELTSFWTSSSAACPAASAGSVSGPAPVWESWSYDAATGNRVSQTRHALGSGGSDTMDTYGYSAAQPHTATSVTHSSAPAGSGSWSVTGADAYSFNSAGETTARPGQSLTWNATGQLATDTPAGHSAQSNVYDADDGLLVRSDETGVTLYLGDTELHTAPGSSVVTGTRTYTVAGVPVAERTSTTAAPTRSGVSWLVANPQGTALVEVNAVSLAVTHRYEDPFGNPRGASAVWSSTHGFLNAPTSTATNLTHLGAREYDPGTGRFISPDPELDPSSLQGINGYSYAGNNPVNLSDPAGTRPPCLDQGSCEATPNPNGSGVSTVTPAAPSGPTGDFGQNRGHHGEAGGGDSGEGSVGFDSSYGFDPGHVQTILKQIGEQRFSSQDVFNLMYWRDPTDGNYYFDQYSYNDYLVAQAWWDAHVASGQIRMKNGTWVGPTGMVVWAYVLGTTNVNLDVIPGSDGPGSEGEHTPTAPGLSHGRASADSPGEGVSRLSGSSCGGESFSPDTAVVMADGSSRPVDEVRVGDRVEATDTRTGRVEARTVTAVWVNHDSDLLDVTVTADGRVSTIHTTQHHLFWDPTRHAWAEAGDLRRGERLRSDHGQNVTVTSTLVVAGAADMWDLTVQLDHNFYVLSGAAALLVHNNGPCRTPWGWTGSQSYKSAVRTVGGGGTIEDIGGTIPTESDAVMLIEESGGTVQRIEDGHLPPNPHTYPHINYTTPAGSKGTLQIRGLGS